MRNDMLLRSYEHVAKQEHWCDNCCEYIHPGEVYKGDVWAMKGGITVFKYHTHPSCDSPPDPEGLGFGDLEITINELEEAA